MGTLREANDQRQIYRPKQIGCKIFIDFPQDSDVLVDDILGAYVIREKFGSSPFNYTIHTFDQWRDNA